jgi:hypothetical protein
MRAEAGVPYLIPSSYRIDRKIHFTDRSVDGSMMTLAFFSTESRVNHASLCVAAGGEYSREKAQELARDGVQVAVFSASKAKKVDASGMFMVLSDGESTRIVGPDGRVLARVDVEPANAPANARFEGKAIARGSLPLSFAVVGRTRTIG